MYLKQFQSFMFILFYQLRNMRVKICSFQSRMFEKNILIYISKKFSTYI